MISRSEFISKLFAYGAEADIAMALARLPETDAGNGDLDILIRKRDIPAIISWLEGFLALPLLSIHRRTDGVTIFVQGIQGTQGSVLSIDFITSLSIKSIPYLSTHEALRRKVTIDGYVAYLHPVDLSLVLLMTHGIRHKGALKPSYYNHIIGTLKDYPQALPERLIYLLGKTQGFDTIDTLSSERCDAKWAQRSLSAYIAQAFKVRGFQALVRLGKHYLTEFFVRLRTPKKIIAFYGVDGAGKTTLIHNLKPQLNQLASNVRYCHFLPVFPWQHDANSTRTLANPHGKNMRSFLSSTAKLAYFLVLYRLAYWWPWQGSVLFVYDRYAPDMLVDPRRFRYGGSMSILSFFTKLIPQADISILVDIQPETAQKRKQEVPLEQTHKQVEGYRLLIKDMKNPLIIKGDMNQDMAASIVSRHILQALQSAADV